jgi:hypothetical protein
LKVKNWKKVQQEYAILHVSAATAIVSEPQTSFFFSFVIHIVANNFLLPAILLPWVSRIYAIPDD